MLATLIGFVASAVSMYSFQRKNTRNIFIAQIFSGSLWVAHFMLIGALSGALINALNVCKLITFVYVPKRFESLCVAIYLIALYVLYFCVIGHSWVEALPMISATFSVFLIYVRDNRYIVARASLLSALLWLCYGIINGSLPAMLNDTFILISVWIGMLRHEKKPFKLWRFKA